MKEKVVFWLLAAVFVVSCVCILLFSNLSEQSDMVYVSEITSAVSIEESVTGVTVENSTAVSQAEIININTATQEELMTLPGVGEVIAGYIVEYREKNGGFDSIEEIMEVSGIGEVKFENIKPLICV